MDDLIATALKRFDHCSSAESENRELALADLEFEQGDQWPEDVKEKRKDAPCLTVNKIPSFVRQIVNDIRQMWQCFGKVCSRRSMLFESKSRPENSRVRLNKCIPLVADDRRRQRQFGQQSVHRGVIAQTTRRRRHHRLIFLTGEDKDRVGP